MLRHGLQVTEMGDSNLPGKPNAIWTLRKQIGDKYHKYTILSFNKVTMVLNVGDNIVESEDDTGFD